MIGYVCFLKSAKTLYKDDACSPITILPNPLVTTPIDKERHNISMEEGALKVCNIVEEYFSQ